MTENISHTITLKPDFLPACSMHYLAYGDSSNPVVFCVHGLTSVAHEFDYIAAALKDDFYVIAPDMPGRGKSSHLEHADDYNNLNYMHYCFALLDALDIEHVHWIGASMGGIIGMMAGAQRPALLHTLFLGDVGKVLAKEGLENIFSYVGNTPKAQNNAEFEANLKQAYASFHFTKEEYWRHFFNHRVRKNEKGEYRLLIDPKVLQPFKAKSDVTIEDVSLEALWSVLDCPVLIFRGAESQLLRHDTAVEMTQDKNNVTLHEFKKVGHMPNLMEEEQVDIISNWILMHRS